MCTLTVCEDDPRLKRSGSPGAPALGDKGIHTHNMYSALSEEERDEGPPPLTDSESEESEPSSSSRSCNRWRPWRKVAAKRKGHRRPARVPTTALCLGEGVVGGTSCAKEACSPKVMDSARSLIEISMNSLNGLSEETDEWEEIEFMVDNGAGTTLIGPEHAKAVNASEPDPDANYKLAVGSIINNESRKTFTAAT